MHASHSVATYRFLFIPNDGKSNLFVLPFKQLLEVLIHLNILLNNREEVIIVDSVVNLTNAYQVRYGNPILEKKDVNRIQPKKCN
jgi:hypothetical protein